MKFVCFGLLTAMIAVFLVIAPVLAHHEIAAKFDTTKSVTVRGTVTSIDWASYPIITFSDVPKIDIDLIDRPNEPPTGSGEASCAPVGAALANAVFDATGTRLRTLPLTPERVKESLARRST